MIKFITISDVHFNVDQIVWWRFYTQNNENRLSVCTVEGEESFSFIGKDAAEGYVKLMALKE